MGGMVSLAQATFVTAGGLTAGWALNYDWGVDIPLVASHGQLNFSARCAPRRDRGRGDRCVGGDSGSSLGGASLAIGTLALAFSADVLVFSQTGSTTTRTVGPSARPPSTCPDSTGSTTCW